jgi:hypothetical protein
MKNLNTNPAWRTPVKHKITKRKGMALEFDVLFGTLVQWDGDKFPVWCAWGTVEPIKNHI